MGRARKLLREALGVLLNLLLCINLLIEIIVCVYIYEVRVILYEVSMNHPMNGLEALALAKR